MDTTDQIIKLIDELALRFGVVIDWSNAEIVPYLQELMTKCISYQTAKSIMDIIIGIAIVVIAFICFKYVKHFGVKADEKDELYIVPCITLAIIGLIMIPIGLTLSFSSMETILKCTFIPELQIFEYLKAIKT